MLVPEKELDGVFLSPVFGKSEMHLSQIKEDLRNKHQFNYGVRLPRVENGKENPYGTSTTQFSSGCLECCVETDLEAMSGLCRKSAVID